MTDTAKSHDTSFIYIQESATSTLILRNRPKIMDGLKKVEWESFCDEIDTALTPIVQFKRNRNLITIICQFNLVLLLIDFTITQVILHDFSNEDHEDNGWGLFSFFQAFDPDSSSSVGDIFLLSHFIFTCTLCGITFFYIHIWKHIMGLLIKSNIQTVFSDFVLHHPSFVFAVKNYSMDKRLKEIIDKNSGGDTFCCWPYSAVTLPIYIEVSTLSASTGVDQYHHHGGAGDPLFGKSTEILDDGSDDSSTASNTEAVLGIGKNNDIEGIMDDDNDDDDRLLDLELTRSGSSPSSRRGSSQLESENYDTIIESPRKSAGSSYDSKKSPRKSPKKSYSDRIKRTSSGSSIGKLPSLKGLKGGRSGKRNNSSDSISRRKMKQEQEERSSLRNVEYAAPPSPIKKSKTKSKSFGLPSK